MVDPTSVYLEMRKDMDAIEGNGESLRWATEATCVVLMAILEELSELRKDLANLK